MKRRFARWIPVTVVALAAALAPVTAHARLQLPDAPARFVYDQPGVLSADERRVLEDSLMAYDRAGIEIGVAIFESIGGEPIEDVSMALAGKWRPGSAERDNGALIVIALEERAMRIEVGYGLEPVLNDARAGRIIRGDMAPAFREGRFGDGILRAVTNIARYARGEAVPEPAREGPPPWLPLLIVGVIIVVLIFLALAARHGNISGRGFDSGWGGRGPYGGLHRRGGGNWWSSGGFGGGGFGGGGFGGGSFGGGSFGGGGASGRW